MFVVVVIVVVVSGQLSIPWPLTIVPISFFGISVKKKNYQRTLRNNPEERRLHLHRGGESGISHTLTRCHQLLRNQEKVFRLFGKLVAFFMKKYEK